MEFKNLKQLMTYLKDDDVCREYYAELRWGGNPVCPHCGAKNIELLFNAEQIELLQEIQEIINLSL